VRKLHLLLLPALLAFALGLAACGGGESEEDKIASTIESAATSTDPAVCDETQTIAFMEQTTGESGKAAEKECEKEAEAGTNQPDSVSVTKVEADGENATANAEFKGGNLGGQTLELTLVEEGGGWKLDELTGFAKFDPAPIVKQLDEQLQKNQEIDPETGSCVVAGVKELPSSALEAMLLENNSEAIVEIAEGCE
jgi:ABC-type glycerol-3-phosphate transport system substrate-binding protein